MTPCRSADNGASRSARTLLHRWRLPLALAAVQVALQAAGWTLALEYRRAAVLQGQLWRLMSGSFVNLGWVHFARNTLGLFLIWGLFPDALDERDGLQVLLVSDLAVGVGLLAFSPQIAWYVGISGPLFGLFSAGALCGFRRRPVYAGTLLLGMAVVIAWTLHAGALPGEARGLGAPVVPQAHLYGAIGGAAFILMRAALRMRRVEAGSRRDRLADRMTP